MVPGVLLFCAVGLWGGFYSFTADLWGGIFSALLILLYQRNGSITISFNVTGIGLGLMLCAGVISIFAAVDRGMAGIGVIRVVALVIFWLVWNQIDTEEREGVFSVIPLAGTLWTLLSYGAYVIPSLRENFYRANRLGGPFQYSNAYAVFLLVGLIVLFYDETKRKAWTSLAQAAVLFSGIIFTGSRSVFVLTAVVLVFLMLRSGMKLRTKLGMIAAAVGLTLGLQLVMKLDVERLLILTMDSSTLNGRFLYWQDAVSQILRHPFGLGYMGYFYLQPQFQTGNYVTRFVHNDFLQTGLDFGILALVAVALMVVYGIWKQRGRNRMILVVLMLHALFDFDMQFFVMACLALMCLPLEDAKLAAVSGKKFLLSGCAVGCAVFCYFTMALGLEYFGRYEQALQLYPWNTEARAALLREQGQDKSAVVLAEKLIQENGMLADAYEVMLREETQARYMLGSGKEGEQDVDQILEYERQMLRCAGYDSYYYNQAVYYLSFALAEASEEGGEKAERAILEEILRIPDVIDEKEGEASELAYKIVDHPEIILEDEILEYLEELKELEKGGQEK